MVERTRDPRLTEVFLVEVSSEVGNKVGGIYGVLASKATMMMQTFPHYLTVGLYNHATSPADFIPKTPPVEIDNVLRTLTNEGVQPYYGLWKGGRNAPCVLLDIHEYMNRTLAEDTSRRSILGGAFDGPDGSHPVYHLIKRRNWERFRIDSYTSDYFYNEAITWSEVAGHLIELLLTTPLYQEKQTVVLVHEWLSAGVIFRERVFNLPYRTIFNTHATAHGRADSAAGVNVTLKVRDGLSKQQQAMPASAYERSIPAMHFTEIAAAAHADLFTAVSQSVAHEATYYLGKAPQLVLTNGILMPAGRDFREIREIHAVHKESLREFMQAVLSPYYLMEEQESLIVMTSGRYEFVNKGYDLFIKALAKLNEELRGVDRVKPVYAFMLVPTRTRGLNATVLRALTLYRRLRSMLDPVSDHLGKMLTRAIAQNDSTILDRSLRELLNTDVTAREILEDAFEIPEPLTRNEFPPIATHDYDYERDSILDLCWHAGLRNREEDHVKLMIIPSYLSANSPPLYLSYLDFVNGCDVGIFPSRYEPFGLTPVEAAATGSIAVTSDLSGLGEELRSVGKGGEKDGIYVLPLLNRSEDEVVETLTHFLVRLREMPYEELLALKRRAFLLADTFSWREKIKNYVTAVELVLSQ